MTTAGSKGRAGLRCSGCDGLLPRRDVLLWPDGVASAICLTCNSIVLVAVPALAGTLGQDAHNTSVDIELRRDGLCGAVHVATGRRCTLRHGHPDGCSFSDAGLPPQVPGDEVQASR